MRKLTTSLLSLIVLVAACGVEEHPLPDGEPVVAPPDATTPDPDDDPADTPVLSRLDRPFEDDGLLAQLGFTATSASDGALVASGSTSASFSAPVASVDDDGDLAAEALGTGALTVDGDARDLASLAVRGAFPGEDLFYVVLFVEDDWWQQLVIATREPVLTVGEIALDGESAAVVVLDEVTGEARLGVDGTLTLTAVDLDGGSVAGTLESPLYPVSLASWPQDLLPLRADGEPLVTVSGSAQGSFSTTAAGFDDPNAPTGPASVEGLVDGTALALDTAWALLDGQGLIVILEDAAMTSALVVFLDPAQVAPGTIALDGFAAGAQVYLPDGRAIALDEGTVTLDEATFALGASISGSLALSGTGYVLPEQGYEEPPVDEGSCDGLATLASSFAPNVGALGTAADVGGLPDGFSELAILWDDAQGAGASILVPTGADLAAGIDLAPVVVDGRELPLAALYTGTCEIPLYVESGALTLVDDGATMAGSFTYVIEGETRTLDFSVASTSL